MYNVNLVNSRYFDITIGDKVLNLEPCKLKTMQRFLDMQKGDSEDLIELIKEILNKNKTCYKVSDEVIGNLDINEMAEFLNAYFQWIAKEKSNNPN